MVIDNKINRYFKSPADSYRHEINICWSPDQRMLLMSSGDDYDIRIKSGDLIHRLTSFKLYSNSRIRLETYNSLRKKDRNSISMYLLLGFSFWMLGFGIYYLMKTDISSLQT